MYRTRPRPQDNTAKAGVFIIMKRVTLVGWRWTGRKFRWSAGKRKLGRWTLVAD